MAYKDSDELKTDERYPLGDYSFRIERSSVPGSSNDKIEAICTDKDGKNARKSIQVPSSTQFNGWYVEANSDIATVYAKVILPTVNPWNLPPFDPVIVSEYPYSKNPDFNWVFSTPVYAVAKYEGAYHITASDSFFTANNEQGLTYNSISWAYGGKTVYYLNSTYSSIYSGIPVYPELFGYQVNAIAWQMVYGSFEGKEKEIIVARFSIELAEAGGVGPGSDWTDPGDYQDGWEPGEPTYTLNVEVVGALSGRHNDPLEDTSYSYVPSDKATVKDYGCGGDGGNGGGGGAGASTVVVYKFATNQANSKEVTAIARRHGYGSGGGKGGKGGDGCILIYY